MIHEIYEPFDDGFEVWEVFLHITKAFDEIWNERLSLYGTSEKFFKILRHFLYSLKQRVVLNEQHSSRENGNAGVSPGSVFEPLFLLTYINDLPNGVSSNCKFFCRQRISFFSS